MQNVAVQAVPVHLFTIRCLMCWQVPCTFNSRRKGAKDAYSIKKITGTCTGITITFAYKEYSDGKKQKQMTLSHEEFARRFERHILPKQSVKYGMAVISHTTKKTNA